MISVCIPTFNGEKFIKEQLDSILRQISDGDEVVISDDSSTDRTVEIIKSLADPRIILLPNQKFKSPIFNVENALKGAKGSYIFLADQDDIWLNGRVDKMLNLLDNNDLVLSDCKVVDNNLTVIFNSYFKLVGARPGFFRNLLRTSPYIGCCMAFRRRVLEEALPFPAEIPMHDFWIAMISEVKFKICFLHDPLVLYRRHSDNASITASRNTNSIFKKMAFRITLLRLLTIRLLRF